MVASVWGNRIKMDVSGTPGTGSITLNSAATGYQSFASGGIGNSDVVSYVIEDGSDWEVGTGTYTSAGTSLSRDTIHASSNAGSAISATSAAVVSVIVSAEDLAGFAKTSDIGTTIQGYDADLAAFAALDKTSSNFITANGSTWIVQTPTQVISTLGLDPDLPTFSVPASTTISAFGATLVDDANAAAALTTLGLDGDLATFSVPASTTISTFGASLIDDASASAVLTTLGLDTDLATLSLPASTTISSFGASLIDDSSSTNARTTLGLGSIATQDSNSVSITGGTVSGLSSLGVSGTSTIGGVLMASALHSGDDSTAYATALPAFSANYSPDRTFSGGDFYGAWIDISQWSTSTTASGGAFLSLSKSRNATVGSHTLVTSGATVGGIQFNASDGTDFVPAATITCLTSTTTGSNDMPGKLYFYTTPDGSTTPTLRMSISHTGGVYLGAGTGTTYQLELSSNSAAKPTSSSWTTTSDVRVKEDIVPADENRCVEIVKDVQLKHFAYKREVFSDEAIKDRSKLGWLAQDVQRVFPKAVSTVDQRMADGETVMEDVLHLDDSQMVAVMYGAIRNLIDRVEELEAQLPGAKKKKPRVDHPVIPDNVAPVTLKPIPMEMRGHIQEDPPPAEG